MIAFALAAVAAQPDTVGARLARLDALLRAAPSATAVLRDWCADHRLAADPRIVAQVDRGARHPATSAQRRRLAVTPGEVVAYRRVRLTCGTRTLSQAENWYVPSRLTSAMNAALAGDTPFGTAIRPLNPTRRPLSATRLWNGQGAPPANLLRHRALVLGGDGRPLAEVVETYGRDVLADGVGSKISPP